MIIKDKKLVNLIYKMRAARSRYDRHLASLAVCEYLGLGDEYKSNEVWLHNYLEEYHTLDFNAAWAVGVHQGGIET